jgi:hypothetical protein
MSRLLLDLGSLDPAELGAADNDFHQAENCSRRIAVIRRAGIGIVAGILAVMGRADRDATGLR